MLPASSITTFKNLHMYLISKYEKVYYFRINKARTFSGNYITPKDIYQEDMDHDAEPNCIMVKDNGKLKLVVTKAKRAKELIAFKSNYKTTYVPIFVYRNKNSDIKIINN